MDWVVMRSMRKKIALVLACASIVSGYGVYFPEYVTAVEREDIKSVSPTDADEDNETSEIPEEEENDKLETSVTEVLVPIYNYDVCNLVVPATYELSLNPYGMPIEMGNGSVSTDQVLSRKYGIVNKSSTDKIVTINLTVEDLNKDKITFANSPEEVQRADKDTYAVYLALVPADGNKVTVDDAEVDMDTAAAELSDVEMSGAKEHAIALHEGENQIRFKLSKAAYDFENAEQPTTDDGEEKIIELTGLNPDGKSVTAFTFGGSMNVKAEWSKLLNGLKITAVYEYETAGGDEQIVKGTGAMLSSE